MSNETWLAIAAALGLSTLIPTLITYLLKRRDARIEGKQAATTAQVQDSATMRGELWQQLQTAMQRNDALAQQRGQLYQEKAEAQATADAKQRQVDDLLARYSTAAQKLEDAEYRRERDREKWDKERDELEAEKDELETHNAHLERRVLDLEHDIARLTRGEPSRAGDTLNPPRLRDDRRRSDDGKTKSRREQIETNRGAIPSAERPAADTQRLEETNSGEGARASPGEIRSSEGGDRDHG